MDALTGREKEIVMLVLEERSSAEIAETLHLSIRTIDSHRASIQRKLKIRSLIGLMKYAIRQGWVEHYAYQPPGAGEKIPETDRNTGGSDTPVEMHPGLNTSKKASIHV